MANCIIEQILARPELTTKAFPPISTPDLARTEALIGFELPPLLRQLYLRVGNGGFGPHFGGFLGGVNGYEDPSNIAADYIARVSNNEPLQWPEKLVPFFHWGCACYCSLDCSTDDGAVVFYDPGLFVEYFSDGDFNKGGPPVIVDPVPAMRQESNSLSDWLQAWLDGAARMGTSKPRWRPANWSPPHRQRKRKDTSPSNQLKLNL